MANTTILRKRRRKKMRWFRLCLLKAYFDKGMAITSYAKYMIAFYGISSLNPKLTLIIGIIYGLSCFLIGWAWYKYDFIWAEIEVGNKFNLFVKEMRETKDLNSRCS